MNPEQRPVDLQLLCGAAIRFHQTGNLQEAERRYRQILAAQPASFTARHLLGVVRFQEGKTAEAIELIGGALKINPGDAEALTNYGLVLHSAGRFEDALESYDRALANAPHSAIAWNNRGNTLKSLVRHDDALASFDRALAIKSDYAEAWNNRGITLRDMGRHGEALASYNAALGVNRDYTDALFNRGNVLRDLGRMEEALASYDEALLNNPNYAAALYNRGNLLQELKRLSEALASYDRALSVNADDAEAWNNRGVVLHELDRRAEALASYDRAVRVDAAHAQAWYNRGRALQDYARFVEAKASHDKAVAIDPGFFRAWNSRGNALRHLKRFDEALASYDRALGVKPDFVEALNNRGNTLQDLKRFEDALASFDRALGVSPANADALFNRGTTLLHLGRMPESLASHERALVADPGHPDALGGVANAALQLCDWPRMAAIAPEIASRITARTSLIPPFVLLGHSDDAALQLRCAENTIRDRIPVPPQRLWNGAAWRHEKIRIAYISSDFRQHPVAYQIVELLERHDRSRFEVLGISLGNDDRSDIRARIVNACDQFHDVQFASDHDAAALLHRLEVDIAVDLNGHTQDARPGILAHRPAPVQVNYLGYPGTSGTSFMDYIIADRVVAPFDQQPFFSEKIIHLPDCYFATDSKRAIGVTPARAEAGLPDHGFVFCCFNSHWKITKPVFEVWMRLLRTVPGSVLWLSDDSARETLCREAGEQGVDPARLLFAPKLAAQADHLARTGLADLMLDTLPYNAHSTASDALWAGVPLAACRGKAFPGRVAASLLTTIGLPELIAGDLEDYETMALALARDPERLASLRKKLADGRASSPLFDIAHFQRNIETAYEKMLETAGRPQVASGDEVRTGSGRMPAKIAGDWNDRGIALWGQNRREEAIACFDKAVEIDPDHAEAWNNRGAALQSTEHPEEALPCYDMALALKPAYVDALFNRANVLKHLKNFAEALNNYDKALAIAPDHAEAWNNRGSSLSGLHRVAEALKSFDKALALQPDFAEALYNRGKLLWLSGHDAAMRDLERLVEIDPDHDYARGMLLHLRMHRGDWRDFARQVALIDEGIRAGKRVAEPFIYQAISESPADLQKCASLYTDHLYPPGPALWKNHRHARIRVGYVSGEFREQATALLAAGLYELHDRSKFDIFAFDNGRSDDSPTRKRLEAAFDKFIDISSVSDRAAADAVVTSEIDVLVNLNGYFGDLRMEVFARKPAPIQVNYLGFPGTLGARYMDYILADRFVIPPDERQYYTEKVVYLPDTYQVNDSRRAIVQAAASRTENGLPEKGFVYCNFNQGYKLTPEMFAVWMRILRQTEGSVLWLLESDKSLPENLRREAQRQGVASERLVFAPSIPPERHLARLKLADLFLDSLPYNAHTTASDALWAGLPLLTCRGKTFSGRVAASLLHAAGLPELATDNLESYEALALQLARSPALLQSLRQKLARNRLSTPLFDTERFRRNLEFAYETMWDIFRRGEKARSFAVSPRHPTMTAGTAQ